MSKTKSTASRMAAFECLKDHAQHFYKREAGSRNWATKCKNDVLSTKVAQRNGQHKLFRWMRPGAWTTSAAFDATMNADALSKVVECLVASGSVNEIKAFALANRECARAVRAVLDNARRQLLQAQREWQEAGEHAVRGMTPVQQARHPFANLPEYKAFRSLMADWGIPRRRQSYIVYGRRNATFHNSKSMLAHIADGCELCGARMPKWSSYDSGEGPVSLFMCNPCSNRHRVGAIVTVDCTPSDFFADGGFACADSITVKFEDCNHAFVHSGTERARFMLSRKAQMRKRRLRGPHIQLGRQLVTHSVDMTEAMRRFLCTVPEARWSPAASGDGDGERYSLFVAMSLDLPAELKSVPKFTDLMGINETEDLRLRTDAAVARKQRRADARRAALRAFRVARREAKPFRKYLSTITNSPFVWGTLVDLVDTCHAAHAIRVRGLLTERAFMTDRPRRDALSLSRSERMDQLARVRLVQDVAHRCQYVSTTTEWSMLLAIVRKTIMHIAKFNESAALERVVTALAHAPIRLQLAPEASDKLFPTTQRIFMRFEASVDGATIHSPEMECFVDDDKIRSIYAPSQFHVVDPILKRTRLRLSDLEYIEAMSNFAPHELGCDKSAVHWSRMHSCMRTRTALYEAANSEHWPAFIQRILAAAR